MARDQGVRSIAFPAISTGVYGFPMPKAAGIAVAETAAFLEKDNSGMSVIFACFGREAAGVFQAALDAHFAGSQERKQ